MQNGAGGLRLPPAPVQGPTRCRNQSKNQFPPVQLPKKATRPPGSHLPCHGGVGVTTRDVVQVLWCIRADGARTAGPVGVATPPPVCSVVGGAHD
ncbi:hypothetical protein GCM10027610_101750 [Dactylosporangium cerinum]